MRASIFSLMGLFVILVALYIGRKWGAQIPLLKAIP